MWSVVMVMSFSMEEELKPHRISPSPPRTGSPGRRGEVKVSQPHYMGSLYLETGL